jgi:hypothetical protein
MRTSPCKWCPRRVSTSYSSPVAWIMRQRFMNCVRIGARCTDTRESRETVIISSGHRCVLTSYQASSIHLCQIYWIDSTRIAFDSRGSFPIHKRNGCWCGALVGEVMMMARMLMTAPTTHITDYTIGLFHILAQYHHSSRCGAAASALNPANLAPEPRLVAATMIGIISGFRSKWVLHSIRGGTS